MVQGLSPSPPRQQSQVFISPDVPCYTVIEKRGFVDDQDTMWERGSRIYWEGEPSLGLDPINEIAEERMMEYLKKQDQLAQDVAKLNGTAHATLVNAFEARRRIKELEKRMTGASPDVQEQMPIMGARRERKGQARSIEDAPPQVQFMGHRGRGEVAPTNARKRTGMNRQDPNKARASVNTDDKGL